MRKMSLLAVMAIASLSASAQYRDVKLPEKPTQTKYTDFEHKTNGFWCAVELDGGSSVMNSLPNTQYVNLAYTGGYRFSEFLRAGAGLGVRMYVNNHEVRNTDNKFGVPIFANARGNFMSAYDRDGVPFWSVNIGGITQEGFFASPTIGYSFGGLRNNFQVGLCYTLTTFKDCSDESRVYSSFGIKVGYEF